MENRKLKDIKLTKKAKYGIATMCLATVLSLGVASFVNEENDEVVNNNQDDEQQVIVTPPVQDDEEQVVVEQKEKLVKPYTVNATIKTYYFDLADTSKNQENALIYYNGMYTPSMGVDYFYNNLSFDVVAAFSGTVIDKKVDPLYGVCLSIQSKENPELVAIYSSLSNVNLNEGDKVAQGELIAKAGSNTLNSDMGNHLNFALVKNGKNINPLSYISKEIKEI